MPWIGRKKIAFIPVYRSNAHPPDLIPTDWTNQILQRVLFDPDLTSQLSLPCAPLIAADRSLRAYIHAASSGRADLDAVVKQMQVVDLPVPGGKDFNDVPVDYLEGQLGSQLRDQEGFDAAAIVMLGGVGAATSERGGFWARFVMEEQLGKWAMELMHVLTNFFDLYTLGPNGYTDYPYGDIGRFDQMSCSCGTHPSAYTKAAIGWLDDSAIAKHTGHAGAYALHAVGLIQPPPSGRSTAVRIGSEVPYLMVEARLKVDQFESKSQLEPGIPSEGVIIYRVQTSDPSGLPQNNLIPVFLLTTDNTTAPPTPRALAVGQAFTSDTNVSVSVIGAIPGGFLVNINDGNFVDDFTVNPGTAVTAIGRNPDHLDLFVTGTDGGIYSIYWDAASSWASSWFRISEGVAELGSPITAVARNPDHLDLFVTGTDGGIYSIYWDANSGWPDSWFRL